jgi:hypothetical protein
MYAECGIVARRSHDQDSPLRMINDSSAELLLSIVSVSSLIHSDRHSGRAGRRMREPDENESISSKKNSQRRAEIHNLCHRANLSSVTVAFHPEISPSSLLLRGTSRCFSR